MRVLQVNSDWNQGGPGNVERYLYETLIKNGHECFVACGRGPCDIDNVIRVGGKMDNYVHYMLSRFTDREGEFSKRATRKLISKIEKLQPDIIQLHNLLGHYINYPMLFNYVKESKIQTVWTLHDCWSFTGHCINFERVLCKKWRNEGCHDCVLKRDYPTSFFIDRSYYNFIRKKETYSNIGNLHIVVPSEWLKRIAQDSFMGDYDIRVFPNGIDLSHFKPVESNLREKYHLNDKVILMSVAYFWNEMKGYNILQELAEKLDDRYQIVMIGNKDEKKLSPKVLSIPAICDFNELIKWYSVADIFVNPTLGDNFPTVNIEALSCGTPIVTCNTGGSPEVAGNIFGRVVYSKTADEFVTKINECYEEHFSADDCHEYAQRFDMGRCYGRYIEFYNSILDNDISQ